MSDLTIKELCEHSHALSKEKGFWDGNLGSGESFVPEKLCLIHEEVSEALGHYRVGDMHTFFFCKCSPGRFDASGFCPTCRGLLKPDGFPIEIADIVIRCGDLAERLGIDLDAAIRAKHAYNRTRPRKHGKVC